MIGKALWQTVTIIIIAYERARAFGWEGGNKIFAGRMNTVAYLVWEQKTAVEFNRHVSRCQSLLRLDGFQDSRVRSSEDNGWLIKQNS